MSTKKKKALSLETIINNEANTSVENTHPEKMLQDNNPNIEIEKRIIITEKVSDQKIFTTIAIPVPVKDKLEEIVFSERKMKRSQNDLFLEGIDMVLKKRGFPSIAKLLKEEENNK